MKIESIAQFGIQINTTDEMILTPTEFIAKAKAGNDNDNYVSIYYKGCLIENILIELDNFLISVLCENDKEMELKTYEIDEFFEVFGYEDFEIVWQ